MAAMSAVEKDWLLIGCYGNVVGYIRIGHHSGRTAEVWIESANGIGTFAVAYQNVGVQPPWTSKPPRASTWSVAVRVWSQPAIHICATYLQRGVHRHITGDQGCDKSTGSRQATDNIYPLRVHWSVTLGPYMSIFLQERMVETTSDATVAVSWTLIVPVTSTVSATDSLIALISLKASFSSRAIG
jgi:hypothetical protein